MTRMTEEERLLSDVLSGDARFRECTLQAGLSALHKRKRRRAARALAILSAPVLLLLALWASRIENDPTSSADSRNVQPVAEIQATIQGTAIRVLSDEQLLSLFEGRPVALVGPPGAQRLLLFDEPMN